MKQLLLGTPFGSAALSIREKFGMIKTAWFHPDDVGTFANDILATKLIVALCQPKHTFVDVGAHIGSVTSAVAHRNASIRIVAVEAIPDKIAKLRRKFPSVEFHECAVGESAGEASFFINLRQSGYSSLGRPRDGRPSSFSEIKVQVRRLDAIVLDANVDAIKIDVEGAELGVLQGSTKILADSRPVVMFESGPTPDGEVGDSKQGIYQLLAAHDYRVLIPNRVAHNDSGLTQDGFLESHLYPRRTTNYFAVPVERQIEVRARARKILKIIAD
jgi:FkbM family methyltransferase